MFSLNKDESYFSMFYHLLFGCWCNDWDDLMMMNYSTAESWQSFVMIELLWFSLNRWGTCLSCGTRVRLDGVSKKKLKHVKVLEHLVELLVELLFLLYCERMEYIFIRSVHYCIISCPDPKSTQPSRFSIRSLISIMNHSLVIENVTQIRMPILTWKWRWAFLDVNPQGRCFGSVLGVGVEFWSCANFKVATLAVFQLSLRWMFGLLSCISPVALITKLFATFISTVDENTNSLLSRYSDPQFALNFPSFGRTRQGADS